MNGNADTDALPKNPSFVTDRVVPGPHTVGLTSPKPIHPKLGEYVLLVTTPELPSGALSVASIGILSEIPAGVKFIRSFFCVAGSNQAGVLLCLFVPPLFKEN